MKISLIVAMDRESGIGHHGKIPWRVSTDLRRFKSLTMGHAIVMGRKTYESIGKALPGRTNIVLTRNQAYQAPGCKVVDSVSKALAFAESQGEREIFIIGGGQIYAEVIGKADAIYMSVIDTEAPADTFFPVFDRSQWRESKKEWIESGENDEYAHTYIILKRKK